MNTRGRHLLAEYRGCDGSLLNDLARVEQLMKRAAHAAGTTIVATVFHPFAPQGVSGVVVVEESHLSIHTWPEHGYAAVDFFTCGDGDPERAHSVLREGLGAQHAELMLVDRGQHAPTPWDGDAERGQQQSALSLRYHRTEVASKQRAEREPSVGGEASEGHPPQARRVVMRAYH